MPHERREEISHDGLVLVTCRRAKGLPGMRHELEAGVVERSVRRMLDREDFRIVEYVVMWDHLHFAVEAKDRVALARGMQGLLIRIARALNRAWGRSGKVFAERYHSRFAQGVYPIRRVVRYVLQNARKHREKLAKGAVDPFSSAPWSLRWLEPVYRLQHPRPTSLGEHTHPGFMFFKISVDEWPGGPEDPSSICRA